MSILGLGLEIVLLFFVLHWARRASGAGLGNLSLALSAKKELLGVIGERLQYIQEHNLKFSGSVDMELTLYEVSKALSKFIEEQDILNTFREKMSSLSYHLDCMVIDEPQLEDYRDGHSSFKISIEGRRPKYFIVKKPLQIERVKLAVMASQLELFLKRSRLYAKIQELSITDSLTGVFVRRYFLERFEQEILRSRHNKLALSLLLIDVDNFKAFNDTYGHLTGDAVLKEIAVILLASLRQIDMCARYGGEEFCIMLPETNKEGALLVAERLRANIQEARIKVFNEELNCTISIGVAAFPDDDQQVNALLDKADKALYRAKMQGKNRASIFKKNA